MIQKLLSWIVVWSAAFAGQVLHAEHGRFSQGASSLAIGDHAHGADHEQAEQGQGEEESAAEGTEKRRAIGHAAIILGGWGKSSLKR